MKKLDKEQKEYVAGLFNEYYNKFTVYDGGGCYDINWSKKLMTDHLKEKGLVEQFEVGKWYKIQKETYHKMDAFQCFQGIGNQSYGFNHSGLFTNKYCIGVWVDDDEVITPATDKEVEEALIKEAKKIGFKEGVTCSIGSVIHKDMKGNYEYNPEWTHCGLQCLSIGHKVIWRSDTGWAEIVEEKKSIIHLNIIQQDNGETIITIPEGVNFEFKTVE